MKKPKFEKLKELLENNEELTVDEAKYKELTCADLPKNDSYTRNKSALSTFAHNNGYYIVVEKETKTFYEKKVVFKKADKTA